MFENYPTNIIQYPCPLHQNERVTHICLEVKCIGSPYLCQLCLQENLDRSQHTNHQQSLMMIGECIRQLSSRIDSSKGQMHKLYLNTLGRREYGGLVKKLEMGDRHMNEVQAHINNLKLQIDKQAESVQMQFHRRLNSTKQTMFAQLDTFLKSYYQNIDLYRTLVDPIVSFSRKLKHYSNSNTISMKLLAELKKKSAEWLMEFKKTVSVASKLLIDKSNTSGMEVINKSSSQMSFMCEELPQFESIESPDLKCMKIQAFINEYLHDHLVVKEIKPLILDNYEAFKFQTVMTPTSTATSGLSTHKEINYISRSPISQIDRLSQNKTTTQIERGGSNTAITRTVIRGNKIP